MYINTKDKEYIKQHCEEQIKNKDQIRVKSLDCLLDEHYALFEIIEYIKNELDIAEECIWRGKNNYLTEMHGHSRINPSDSFYGNVYVHQYYVHKAFNVPMQTVSKYVIHHVDLNKKNNSLSNLWIFFNQTLHREFHVELNKNPSVSISQFTKNWVEDSLNAENSEELTEYLKLLLKAEHIKKCMSLDGLDSAM